MTNKEVYLKILRDIDQGNLFCMCPRLANYKPAMGFAILSYVEESMMERYFPELWAQRPEHIDIIPENELWFPVNHMGMNARRECLLNAIELCHDQQ